MFLTAEEEIEAELADELGDSKGPRLQPAVPTPAEVVLLLRAAAVRKFLYYVIVRILYATGIRRAELAHLQYGDILWDESCLLIRCGKGKKDRYVLVDARTLAHIKNLRANWTPETRVIGLSAKTIQDVVMRCAKDTGLYQKYQLLRLTLSVHSLRHAFATHCYENRLDFYTLSQIMGHTYLSTTVIYTKTARRQAEADYAMSDPASRERLLAMARVDAPPDPTGTPADHPAPRLNYGQEVAAEFATQLQLEDMDVQELPSLSTHQEMMMLLRAAQAVPRDALILQTLYYTGIFLWELLALRTDDLKWDERHLWIGSYPCRRLVLIKPEIFTILREWSAATTAGATLFDLSEAEAEAMIDGYARQIGLAQRFNAIGRRFSSHSIRTAFAVHRILGGMREITLLNQLGHRFFNCLSIYLATAVSRWLPNYTASHELTLQPESFEPEPKNRKRKAPRMAIAPLRQ